MYCGEKELVYFHRSYYHDGSPPLSVGDWDPTSHINWGEVPQEG